MLNRVNNLELQAMYQNMDSGWSNILQDAPLMQYNAKSIGMAEGGFFSPEVEEVEDEYLSLRDILGEEDFIQLEMAMVDYPVVAKVAEMATYTRDGEVSGMGGPTDDEVPARLSDGEFVFSKEAVDVIGLEVLEQLHNEAKSKAASM